jgi:hypothetical protein
MTGFREIEDGFRDIGSIGDDAGPITTEPLETHNWTKVLNDTFVWVDSLWLLREIQSPDS